MSVKPRKQNIPNNWEMVSIADLAEIQTGPFGSQLHESDYIKDGTPIITVENLQNGLVKITDTTPTVKNEDVERLKKYTLKEGDVVFSRVGSVDRSAYVTANQNGWMFSGRILRVRAKKGTNPKFLNYYLSKESTKNIVRNLAVGGTMPSLNTAIFSYVPTFSVPEQIQNRIVAILETWDQAIEKLKRKIEIKKEVKKSMMQELLTGRSRLNGFKGDWQQVKLCQVAKLTKGKDLSKSDLDTNGKYEAIHYGELFTKYSENIGQIISRTDKFNKPFLSEAGDVLMPTSDVTPRGLSTASCLQKEGVILGGDILVVRPERKKLDGLFFSFFVSSHRKHVMRLVSGTTVFHLYGSDLAKLVLNLPPIEEQRKISQILLSSNEELEKLEQKLKVFKDQKKYLLNNLITGTIRTPESLSIPN